MQMPDAAVAHIRAQRTHLPTETPEATKAAYSLELIKELGEMVAFMPDVGRVLDIGCGMAGIDALISKCYDHEVEIHLMDGTAAGKVQAGFHEKSLEPWNDLALSRALLEKNGVRPEYIFTHAPDPDATIENCDVILSLLSWGHHYPAAHYAALAERSLRPGGIVILDVRHGKPGLESTQFGEVGQIALEGINRTKSTRRIYERL